MTEQQINIAIAEHCGWNFNPTWAKEWDSADRWVESAAGERMFRHAIPDYCNDLNAMHEAEKTLHPSQWDNYMDWIDDDREFEFLISSARQRAEAFVKTIGKWEDS
jgi:hypothetical protein